MADRKQRYTVKRIPKEETGLRIEQFEILGPGAPVKRISVGPIAHMIRDALEDGAAAIVEQTLADVNGQMATVVAKIGRVSIETHDPEWPKDPPALPYGVGFYDGRYEEFDSDGEGENFTDALAAAAKAIAESDRV